MISFDEYMARTIIAPHRRQFYARRLEKFQQSCPGRTVYRREDIATHCGESEKITSEMKVVEGFLRLNLQLVEGAHVAAPGPTINLSLTTAVALFMADLRRRNYRQATLDFTAWRLHAFLKYCTRVGLANVGDVDRQTLQLFKEYLFQYRTGSGAPLNRRSQHQWLARVKALFAFLLREDYIINDPTARLSMPRLEKRISRNLFSRNEMEDFLNAIDTRSVYGFMDRTIFELLYATGLRVNELYGLQVSDFNLDEGLIRVNDGKGGKDRVCPLTEISRRYLGVYVARVRPAVLRPGVESEWLFPTVQGARRNDHAVFLSDRVMRYRRLAGIERAVTAHGIRRSFATHLLNEGVDVRYIQQLMGHKTVDSTIQYLNVTTEDLRQVLMKHHPREQPEAEGSLHFNGKRDDNGSKTGDLYLS